MRADFWHRAGSLAILQCPFARIFYFPFLRQNFVLRTFVLSPVVACCYTVLRCLRVALYPTTRTSVETLSAELSSIQYLQGETGW